MGSVLTAMTPMVTSMCPGRACAKYVCNACKLHSKCSECCDVEVETTETTESDHETEVECDGCCYVKKS